MPTKAYLTIDDSPTLNTGKLVEYFNGHNIPALLFCRGDLTAQNPRTVIDAIQRGMVIGNHTYSHKRASKISYEEARDEILKTEREIEKVYYAANVERPGKYFRFSYLDRGTGEWLVNFNAAAKHKDVLKKVFLDGGLHFPGGFPPAPSQELADKKHRLQEFLKSEGFTVPFEGITFDWYNETEIADAVDCFFTYSTSDWMMNKRHLEPNKAKQAALLKENQPKDPFIFTSVGELKEKIDHDPFLFDPNSRHIILAHDQPEIPDVTLELVKHMVSRDIQFLDFK